MLYNKVFDYFYFKGLWIDILLISQLFLSLCFDKFG